MTARAPGEALRPLAPSVPASLVAATGFGLGLAYFFWPMFSTGMDVVPGDIGDARFIQGILEHWFQVARGAAAWRDPPMFYPVHGVLGYSDGLFLYAVPYVLLRFAGSTPVVAYVVTLCLVLAAGYASALWFLRRVLGVSAGIAIVAALTWTFSNLAIVKMVHVNMYAMAFVPLAFGLAWRAVEALNAGRGLNRAGVLLAILVALLLYTSFYMGWFTLLLLAPWAAICAVHRLLCDRSGARLLAARLWSTRWAIAGLAIVFAVCLLPFVATHLPVYLGVQAGRGWEEILPLLPRPIDFINLGKGNVLWGWLARTVTMSSHPYAGELAMGLPPGLIVIFLVTLAVQLGRVARACRTRDRSCTSTEIAVTCLGLLVPLCWIAMLRVGDGSLWSAIHSLVPGGGAVRAVFRLQMLLHLMMLALIGVALDRIWRQGHRRWIVGAVLVILVIEQLNTSRTTYDARAEAARVALIAPPPAQCRFFAIAPGGVDARRPHHVVTQLDAMELGRRFNLPTVHGYSSLTPPHWDLWFPKAPSYAAALVTWLHANHLEEGFCTLDLRDGRWWTPSPGGPDLRATNLVGPDLSLDALLALHLAGFHGSEPIGRWTSDVSTIAPAAPIPGSRLTMVLNVMNPEGTRMKLAIDGTPVLDRPFSPGRHRLELPLAQPLSRLTIDTTIFVPRTVGMNADTRRLGVLVERISVDP